MSKSLADNPFITEAKDKNGDSWYHQIILQEKDKEIERLNNIIKEAIEYIEEKYDYILGDDTFLDHDERIEKKQIDHILEILDKEN